MATQAAVVFSVAVRCEEGSCLRRGFHLLRRPLHLAPWWGEWAEMFWCLVRQFNVLRVVHKEEFSLMRASFYLTHNIDTGRGPLLLAD